MKSILLTCCAAFVVSVSAGQSNYFDVTPNDGYGIRFWSQDNYKIHMGNTSEYHYGTVTDYSIKSNMSGTAGRGWTWGTSGSTPIAALSNQGTMQIAGHFFIAGNIGVGTSTPSNIQGWDRVLDVTSPDATKIIATSSSQTYRVGMYSHTSWNGGGGFIGTETNHKLFFLTNYTPRAVLTTGGNFGIGTLNPQQALDVAGVIAINGVNVINTGNSLNGTDIYMNGRVIRNESTVYSDGMYMNYNSSGGAGAHLRFFADGTTERMRISANTGNIGIGTTDPDAKLAVKGQIHAQEVRVDLLGAVAPDYVFEKNYKLPSLETIKSYIDQHHHLPEVPSAKEMETNGLNLGEMNLLLLKKIEELTLYMIEMKEENRSLKLEIDDIKKKLQ